MVLIGMAVDKVSVPELCTTTRPVRTYARTHTHTFMFLVVVGSAVFSVTTEDHRVLWSNMSE